MNRYRLDFYGRRVRALGASGSQVVDVEAANEEEAREKAYETHEHISGGLDGVRVQKIAE